ncbi:MAG: Ku protein [Deltaproteobacteria bacterium]|nr:Ku protein [Deltaproteobacteria bacterium]
MPETSPEAELRRHAFWSGTLTFGLVSIPVALFSAERPSRVALRLLAPDGTPLHRRYTCPAEDRSLEWEEIVRGYEVEPGKYVVLTEEELEGAEPEKSRDIDLRRFVPADRIDPLYFDRAYFLAPAGQSTRPYKLLADTMERTGLAGLGTFVMRSKEYIVAILAENGLLRAETLRFADEVRAPEALGLTEPRAPSEAEVEKIARAVRAATRKFLDMDVLKDRRAERLMRLVRRKLASGEDVVHLAGEGHEEEEEGGVVDLMELLKRSVEREAEPSEASEKASGGGRRRAGKR